MCVCVWGGGLKILSRLGLIWPNKNKEKWSMPRKHYTFSFFCLLHWLFLVSDFSVYACILIYFQHLPSSFFCSWRFFSSCSLGSSFWGCLTLFQVLLFCRFLPGHRFPGRYDCHCQQLCRLLFEFWGAKPKKVNTNGYLVVGARGAFLIQVSSTGSLGSINFIYLFFGGGGGGGGMKYELPSKNWEWDGLMVTDILQQSKKILWC